MANKKLYTEWRSSKFIPSHNLALDITKLNSICRQFRKHISMYPTYEDLKDMNEIKTAAQIYRKEKRQKAKE